MKLKIIQKVNEKEEDKIQRFVTISKNRFETSVLKTSGIDILKNIIFLERYLGK